MSGLEDARRLVESALGVSLQAHESSYHCGDYYRLDFPKGASLILQQNYDSFDEEWTEESFQETPYLLYVSKHEHPDEVKNSMLLQGEVVAFLKRDEVA